MKKILLNIIVAFTFIACGGSSGNNSEKNIFKEWNGSYKSVSPALEDSQLNGMYSQIATEKGKTTAQVKQAVLNLLGTKGVEKINIKNNSITYTYKGNTFTYNYEDKGVSKDKKFFLFETTSQTINNPQFKYVYVTKPHRDKEDSMLHFHLKFGKDGFSELEKSMSFPTFTLESTSLTKIIENYKSEKEELAGFIK